MTIQLPESLTYGKVVGRFLRAVGDTSADVDNIPDGVAATGSVTFTPALVVSKEPANDPQTAVIRDQIPAVLDSQGYLTDAAGNRGIWLVAGVYKVAYNVVGVTIQGHNIEVLSSHTELAPLRLIANMTSSGAVLTVSQYSELSGRIDTLNTVSVDIDGTPIVGTDRLVTEPSLQDPSSPAGSYLNSTFARGSQYATRTAVDAFAGLASALDAGERSVGIQVLSDSTGDGPTDWPYLLAQSIAAEHPALSVHWRGWNDTTQDYSRPAEIQTGTAGPLYLDCSGGTVPRNLSADVSPHLSGAIDVRLKLSLADWTPTSLRAFLGKSEADPVRSWYLGIQASNGRPIFYYTPTGLGAGLVGRVATVAPTVADGAVTWLRWVFIPDNGAGGNDFKAYQSTDDGATWTQLGATVTTAGVATIFNNSTVGYTLGNSSKGGIGDPTAKIYEIEIRDGVDGPNVVPALPDLWPSAATAGTPAPIVGAPVLTVVNGSKSGANIAYLGDSARLPKLTPDLGQAVTILSDSHNEGAMHGRGWTRLYGAWASAVQSAVDAAPLVILTQNPEKATATNWRAHAQRARDLLAYAAARGYGAIDTFKAFAAQPSYESSLMADSVHPNAAGGQVLADTIKAALDSA